MDTGSNDATLDIAKQYRARVKVDRDLADRRGRLKDFAAARNAVLSMAQGNWILSIDADEILHVEQPIAVDKLLSNRDLNAIEVRILSGGVRWYLPRLFRRKPWTRWHERVHEWVEIRGPTRRTDAVSIENLPNKQGKETAAERDIRLCSQQLKEDPENLRAVFYMARALRNRGRYRAALTYYDRFWKESRFRAGRYAAAIGGAICCLLLRELHMSRRFAMRAYRLDSRLAEACCILGDVNLGLGHTDLAYAWFERALEKRMPGRSYPLFIDQSSYEAYPLARIKWMRDRLSLGRERRPS